MKLKIVICFVFAALVALLPVKPVCAENSGVFGVGMRIGHIEVGSSKMGEVDTDFDDTVIPEVNLTYLFNEHFSVELSGQTFKSDMFAAFDDKTGELGRLTQTPILLTLRYHHRVQRSNLFMFIGGGVGYFINELDYNTPTEVNDFWGSNYKNIEVENGFGGLCNAGAEYFISKDVAINADIKFLINSADFNIDHIDGSKETESVGLNSTVIGLGIKYYF